VTVLNLFKTPRWYATCVPRCSTSSGSASSPRLAQGIGERKVFQKHVVRNAVIPVVLVALQMPIVFGAIVTEQIFRAPGIGSLLISAMLANGAPVVMAVTFVIRSRRLCNLIAISLWLAWPASHR
jgi:ABC-type dipeptide/oligopeptide/nickel transport system permease component